jgi:hypothetical protein
MIAYTVSNGLRMSERNPLYQNCRVVVKKGMTVEEVQRECGEPVFDTGGTTYRIMTFMESRMGDEDLAIKFREGRVISIEIEPM